MFGEVKALPFTGLDCHAAQQRYPKNGRPLTTSNVWQRLPSFEAGCYEAAARAVLPGLPGLLALTRFLVARMLACGGVRSS